LTYRVEERKERREQRRERHEEERLQFNDRMAEVEAYEKVKHTLAPEVIREVFPALAKFIPKEK
jgi:hypothetical protein